MSELRNDIRETLESNESSSSGNSNKQLIDMLIDFQTKLIDKTIVDKELILLAELYVKNKIIHDESPMRVNDNELLKYLTLGYYIYNFILDKDSAVPMANPLNRI